MMKFHFSNVFITSAVFLFLSLSIAHARIIRIPSDVRTIQQGISTAEDGDTVLVRAGDYVEQLDYSGKNICIGSLFLTTGDASYIESTVIGGGGNGRAITFNHSENRHARLCGFTITGGRVVNGGGIYCNQSDPTLDHLVIEGNSASEDGGGIYCEDHSLPLISDCEIRNNYAGEHGGGFYCRDDSDPVFNNVIIRDNEAGSGGGMYFNFNSQPELTEVWVINNRAGSMGGGIASNGRCVISMSKVALAGNFAGSLYGGGMYIGASDVIMENITVADNVTNGNGGGFRMLGSCDIVIHNSIFWNNYPEQAYQSGSPDPAGAIDVSYSDFTNGRNGLVITGNARLNWQAGNISDDPLFADSNSGDYNLLQRSPCIDTGDPDSPADPDDSRIDMGAFFFDHRVGVEEDQYVNYSSEFSLSTYPNPFNNATTISYNLNVPGKVKLTLSDLLGREVNNWEYGWQNVGNYRILIDGNKLTSGIYTVRLETGKQTATQRLICIK